MHEKHKTNSLYELLIPWIDDYFHPVYSTELTGIQSRSQDITVKNLFVALQGHTTDGRLYINEAIEQGAIAILSEFRNCDVISVSGKYINNFRNIPLIRIRYLNQYLSEIAGRFYGHPSSNLNLIGVTGTNGKTTVTCLLAQWIQLLGEKSAVMGTLGNGVLDFVKPSCNTTNSAIDTQKILAQLVKDKIRFVAMEVSSHGLAQHRVDSLYFKIAVFTNLSHDHLDYHGNMTQYMMAKWRLFNKLYVEKYVINADDLIGYKWLSYLPQSVAIMTRMKKLPNNWKGKWICVVKVDYYFYGTNISFHSSWGSGLIHSCLLGDFNVNNILLALGTLLMLGYSLSSLLCTSPKLLSIPGRMEVLRSYRRNNQPMVIIDYAHTPDALRKVLVSLKKFCYGQLWCIFGCGGDRDQNKRALMGSIAARYADYIIITNDNPRTENPQDIINDIICGITCVKNNIRIIKDRTRAIRIAITQAQSEDIILIAGKGHERYQIIKNNCLYYSDQDVVNNCLG